MASSPVTAQPPEIFYTDYLDLDAPDKLDMQTSSVVKKILNRVDASLCEQETLMFIIAVPISLVIAPLLLIAFAVACVFYYITRGYTPAELIAKRLILDTHTITPELLAEYRSKITFSDDGEGELRQVQVQLEEARANQGPQGDQPGRIATLEANRTRTKSITINVSDGAVLDGMEILSRSSVDKPVEQQKWFLCLHGRSSCMEYKHPEYEPLVAESGANLMSANFREMGNSKGTLKSDKDLIRDCIAMVDHLLKKGVKPENILLWGHSLGGGVASAAALQLQEKRGVVLNVLNERSFSTLSDAMKSITWIPVIRHIVAGVANTWWKLESVRDFRKLKGKTFVIADPYDGVIRYTKASLDRQLFGRTASCALRILRINRAPEAQVSWRKQAEYFAERHSRLIDPKVLCHFVSNFLEA